MGDAPAPPERFLADAMLGRLARWLRALGHDTLYFPDVEDERLLRLAAKEGRLLLTRDTRLAALRRPGVRSLLIRANDTRGQLRELRAAVEVGSTPKLNRCLECNDPLVEAGEEEVRGTVPDHVQRTQTAFRRCPRCGRVYWPGSHVSGMAVMLGERGEEE